MLYFCTQVILLKYQRIELFSVIHYGHLLSLVTTFTENTTIVLSARVYTSQHGADFDTEGVYDIIWSGKLNKG